MPDTLQFSLIEAEVHNIANAYFDQLSQDSRLSHLPDPIKKMARQGGSQELQNAIMQELYAFQNKGFLEKEGYQKALYEHIIPNAIEGRVQSWSNRFMRDQLSVDGSRTREALSDISKAAVQKLQTPGITQSSTTTPSDEDIHQEVVEQLIELNTQHQDDTKQKLDADIAKEFTSVKDQDKIEAIRDSFIARKLPPSELRKFLKEEGIDVSDSSLVYRLERFVSHKQDEFAALEATDPTKIKPAKRVQITPDNKKQIYKTVRQDVKTTRKLRKQSRKRGVDEEIVKSSINPASDSLHFMNLKGTDKKKFEDLEYSPQTRDKRKVSKRKFNNMDEVMPYGNFNKKETEFTLKQQLFTLEQEIILQHGAQYLQQNPTGIRRTIVRQAMRTMVRQGFNKQKSKLAKALMLDKLLPKNLATNILKMALNTKEVFDNPLKAAKNLLFGAIFQTLLPMILTLFQFIIASAFVYALLQLLAKVAPFLAAVTAGALAGAIIGVNFFGVGAIVGAAIGAVVGGAAYLLAPVIGQIAAAVASIASAIIAGIQTAISIAGTVAVIMTPIILPAVAVSAFVVNIFSSTSTKTKVAKFIPEGEDSYQGQLYPGSKFDYNPIPGACWPASGTISAFETYNDGSIHNSWGLDDVGSAVDITTGIGEPVYTPAAGTVTAAGVYPTTNPNGGYGNWVVIKLDEGGDSLIFGHLSDWLVYENQHIEAGEVIGLTGNSGNSSGPHLHFESINIQNPSATNDVRSYLPSGASIGQTVNVSECSY